MSTPVSHRVVYVAGLPVNVYSYADLSATTGNVAIFFLLHGRTGSAAQLHPRIGDIFKQVEANKAGGRKQERELLIVTFVGASLYKARMELTSSIASRINEIMGTDWCTKALLGRGRRVTQTTREYNTRKTSASEVTVLSLFQD